MRKYLLLLVLPFVILFNFTFVTPAFAGNPFSSWWAGVKQDIVAEGVDAVTGNLDGLFTNAVVSLIQTIGYKATTSCGTTSLQVTMDQMDQAAGSIDSWTNFCEDNATPADTDELIHFPHGYFLVEDPASTEEYKVACCKLAVDTTGPTASIQTPAGSPVGGALGVTVIALTAVREHPPLNFAMYLEDLTKDAVIPLPQPKSAYAAFNAGAFVPDYLSGLFEGMVLKLWKVMRDFCYAATVVVMVIMGFQVMFRSKVGKGVVNIMTVLPRIIVGLLMITFSYPIGAMSIQLIHAGIAIVIQLFGNLIRTDVEAISASLMPGTGSFFGNLINATVLAIVDQAYFTISTFGAGQIIMLIIGALILWAWLLLLISILITSSGRYVNLILMTLTAPVVFLAYMLPGNDDNLNNWVKGYFANIIAVPAMFGGLMLSAYVLIYGVFSTSIVEAATSGTSIVGALGLMQARLGVMVMALLIAKKARKLPSDLDNMLKAKVWVGAKAKKK